MEHWKISNLENNTQILQIRNVEENKNKIIGNKTQILKLTHVNSTVTL